MLQCSNGACETDTSWAVSRQTAGSKSFEKSMDREGERWRRCSRMGVGSDITLCRCVFQDGLFLEEFCQSGRRVANQFPGSLARPPSASKVHWGISSTAVSTVPAYESTRAGLQNGHRLIVANYANDHSNSLGVLGMRIDQCFTIPSSRWICPRFHARFLTPVPFGQ
jgi:hypothetical protein